MDSHWLNGTRVRISPHLFWPAGGTGTVRQFPSYCAEVTGSADGCIRRVRGANRMLTFIWVVFDTPMFDGDDDGPYQEGEIDADELEIIE